jgi:hypothetical protein
MLSGLKIPTSSAIWRSKAMPNNPGPDARFAIIEIPPGPSPSEAIIVGNLSQVTEYLPQSVARLEAEQRLAQAKEDAAETERHQQETRDVAARMLVHGLTRLGERLDGFEVRKAEREEQQRRDAEEAEAAAVERMLAELPDPDAPDAETVLKDAAHVPSGDLHSVEPVDTEHLDPEGEHRAEATTGAMPRELDKGAPPLPGDYTREVTPASPYRDPTAIGGN